MAKLVKIDFKLNYADEFDMQALGVLTEKQVKELNKKIEKLADADYPMVISFGSNQQIDTNYKDFGIFSYEETTDKETINSFLDNIIDSINEDFEEASKIGFRTLKSEKYKEITKKIKNMEALLSDSKINYVGVAEEKYINSINELSFYTFTINEQGETAYIYIFKYGRGLKYSLRVENHKYRDCGSNIYYVDDYLPDRKKETLLQFKRYFIDFIDFEVEKIKIEDSYTLSVIDFIKEKKESIELYEKTKDTLTYSQLNKCFTKGNDIDLEFFFFDRSERQINNIIEKFKQLNYDVSDYEEVLNEVIILNKKLLELKNEINERIKELATTEFERLIKEEPEKVIEVFKSNPIIYKLFIN